MVRNIYDKRLTFLIFYHFYCFTRQSGLQSVIITFLITCENHRILSKTYVRVFIVELEPDDRHSAYILSRNIRIKHRVMLHHPCQTSRNEQRVTHGTRNARHQTLEDPHCNRILCYKTSKVTILSRTPWLSPQGCVGCLVPADQNRSPKQIVIKNRLHHQFNTCFNVRTRALTSIWASRAVFLCAGHTFWRSLHL